MIKRSLYLTVVLTFLCFGGAEAQKRWTLEECVRYALDHNLQVKQQAFQTQSEATALKSARFAALPAVNAGISDGLNFGRTQGSDGIYTSSNANSASIGVNADIPLFQGLRITHNVKSQKMSWMASIEDENAIKQDITLNICSQFLQVLFAKEMLRVSQEQLQLTEMLEARTLSLVENGVEPETKLYELRAQKASEMYTLTNAKRDLQVALLDLAQTLELEQTAGFDVIEPEVELSIDALSIPAMQYEEALKIMPQVQAEQYRLESAKYALKEAKAAYYPSLSLGAGINSGHYYYFNTGVNALNDAFGKQLKDNFRSSVSISLSIPIFNRMNVKHQVAQQRIRVEGQDLKIEQSKKDLFKTIQRAHLNVQSSKERYLAAQQSIIANETSFNFTQKSFEAGRSTSFDLQQAKTGLEKSRSEFIQAKYEFLLNRKILLYYQGQAIVE